MIPACDRQTDGQTVRRTESVIVSTALCIASYANALQKLFKVAVKREGIKESEGKER